MLIAIDYDETYTVDPYFWDIVIGLGWQQGHEFICITARSEQDKTEFPDARIKTIYTAGEYKKEFCAKLGIHPDIWIDDAPEVIAENRCCAGCQKSAKVAENALRPTRNAAGNLLL